ncbi:hypothetical protein E3C22_12795 [Jiella endophytica]|uniref:Methyltransferase FkbM domain-containing protein n=1 Tax=Jiella endophytica TaxID=2558362 RepID=A0A4Y8RLG4_9HYPH|nr:FkbM family methyltransferase [Jiella endophytica]TFF23296.1 hypothetical protein E3C22_12795 [Jiella endophytica]
MPVIEVQSTDRRKAESTFLLNNAKNVHSQNGEDGILGALYDLIGTKNKWCVEFGAWDGVHLSNTCDLIRSHGWYAVQIEGNGKKFETLKENFKDNDRVRQIHAMVGYEPGVNTLEDYLATTEIPEDFDLLSIDIDGNDWYIWESVKKYRPRVVVIEFNPTVPNEVVFIQDKDMSINEGCSLAALIKLGKEKGYELACVTKVNGIFVRSDEFPKLGIKDNSIDAMHRKDAAYIFQGYNGKIYQTMGRGYWRLRNTELGQPDSLQILPERSRQYQDRVKTPTDEDK